MSTLRAFTMPKWGIEMQEGTIGEWNVRDGDSVRKGQVLAQIETDKVINEVVSDFEMTIARLVGAVGETYPVGALLAVTATGPASAEEIDAFIKAFRSAGSAETRAGSVETRAVGGAELQVGGAVPRGAEPRATSAGSGATASALRSPASGAENRQPMSAAARDYAAARSMDVTPIRGSGRAGRITLQDVQQAAKPAPAVQERGPVSIAPKSTALDGYYASPFAKRLAVEHGIDLSRIGGTGPHGRISRGDVMMAGGLSPPPPRSHRPQIVRMSAMRKAIARQLTLSKSTIPHFYLRIQVNMDALLALRLQLRRTKAAATIPTVNDYFIRAAALGLVAHPELNVQVHGDEIHHFPTADVAVAVATDRGLITPVVQDAGAKTVADIAGDLRTLIERARAGKLSNDEMTGGCLTVSNLGMLGVEQFDAIINPPQAAILAVGAPRRVATEVPGRMEFASLAWLSLSCDHRAIDGATGAKFLASLRALIEGPEAL